jgi:nanoRNase/pAp phosphatase (c-di-AMP/oligoRNAs hydrolase)
MNDVKIKQQVIEKIKSATNILVTVSNDPSVDALSAALGLTLMLNKLDKHATAVFSGAIPPAITFLDPAKTFESTTDSLRDFIIALDKEKADHLRYKVEGDVVKIFITPYRTTITSEDLDFSQGDYNVELVIALGVDNQDHLDKALEAHGKILHDAAVITVSAGDQVSQLGSIDWREAQASSLCEMLVGLSDGIKTDKEKNNLLDQQTATSLLTGIVAATDRFSNTKTSSRVMTVAAQLMAAGADQQLIAAKLQESHAIDSLSVSESDGASIEDTSTQPATKSADGGLSIAHEDGKTLEDIANMVKKQDQQEAAVEAEQALADQISATTPPVVAPVAAAYASEQPTTGGIDWKPTTNEPSLGGTLNATTEQAEEETRREEEDDKNKTILTHSYLGESAPTFNTSINSAEESDAGEGGVDIFAGTTPQTPSDQPVGPIAETVVQPLSGPSLADLDAENRDAAPAPEVVVEPTVPPVSPIPQDATATLPQPPPLPVDFSTLPPPTISPAYALDPALQTPERLGDIFAPEQPTTPQAPPTPPADSSDPGQFKIPGQ